MHEPDAPHNETPIPSSVPESPGEGTYLSRFDVSVVSTLPGCYIMRDGKGVVIYVGKAKNLRTRLRQYVHEQDSRYSVKFLARHVASIEVLVTQTEKEALLLENSLIKREKPRYNVQLKDDKTYVSLRLDPSEPFPRVTVIRRRRKDGARYFGPYASARAVRESLRFIHRVFPLRRCSDSVMRNRTRPCLYHQIGQCLAPCVGYTDAVAYGEIVRQVMLVLDHRTGELEKDLLQRIQDHAEKLEFEKAAVLRDRLYALRQTFEKQRTVAVPGAEDRDVFGVYAHGRYYEFQVLHFREGKLIGGRSFSFSQVEGPPEDLLTSFLLQYYGEESMETPPEVLTPLLLEDAETLSEILSEQRGTRVSIHYPQRGDKAALVEMAQRNAKTSFEEKRLSEKAEADLLEETRKSLHLTVVPNRIECFDISTTQGVKPVGAMAVFTGGKPDKARYRHYAIREVEGQDDFGMLREVLMRRYQRGIAEGDLPDLAVIDGGRGQLNVALAVFKDLGIEDLAVIGMAKSRAEGDARSPERFFLPGRTNPVVPPAHSPVVHMLTRLRDETHRFAITYHRKRRGKEAGRSLLQEIEGVGPKRAKTLLTAFGSVARIRERSIEDIAALPGFTEALACTIKASLTESRKPGAEEETKA